MTNNRFASRDRLDEPVVHALRDLLAPPGGEAYWTELEDSIMARLDSVDLGWWGELTHWVRPALVAAAVLIMTATAALVHTSQSESHAMYESVAAAGCGNHVHRDTSSPGDRVSCGAPLPGPECCGVAKARCSD